MPILLGAALAWAGCRQAPSDPAEPAVAAPPPTAQPAPVDHLASDELVEGDKKAFGMTLPRDLHIDGDFADEVVASGHVGVRPLAKYFRARVTEGSLRVGDEAATFDHVHIPGKTASEFSLHVWLTSGVARVQIRDTTPPMQPSLPDDVARWRQAGLTPQGRLLDPMHME